MMKPILILYYLWLHNHEEGVGEDLSNDDGDKYDEDNSDDVGGGKISHNVSMIDLLSLMFPFSIRVKWS